MADISVAPFQDLSINPSFNYTSIRSATAAQDDLVTYHQDLSSATRSSVSQAATMSSDIHATRVVSGDSQNSHYNYYITPKEPSPQANDEHKLREVENLKVKNASLLDKMVATKNEVDKHLTRYTDHYLQISQMQLVFGAGTSTIHIRPDASVSLFNAEKIALASHLLEHDLARTKSLFEFYNAQQRYFSIIRDMQETEVEIQECLTGIGAEGDLAELEQSKARFVTLEQCRLSMGETWLEWLEDVA